MKKNSREVRLQLRRKSYEVGGSGKVESTCAELGRLIEMSATRGELPHILVFCRSVTTMLSGVFEQLRDAK